MGELTFRQAGSASSAEVERAWGEWFGRIGEHIVEFGRWVGQARMVGQGPSVPDELAGYIVISAGSLDAAAQVAEGCPGLRSGGRVEVGAVVPAEQ
jgi:hypothetical protein